MKGILSSLDNFEFSAVFRNNDTTDKEVFLAGDLFKPVTSFANLDVDIVGLKDISANGQSILQSDLTYLIMLFSRYPLIVDSLYIKGVSNIVGGTIRYFMSIGQASGDETGFLRILPGQFQGDVILFKGLNILLAQFTGVSFRLTAGSSIETIWTCKGIYTGSEPVRLPGINFGINGGSTPTIAPPTVVVGAPGDYTAIAPPQGGPTYTA